MVQRSVLRRAVQPVFLTQAIALRESASRCPCHQQEEAGCLPPSSSSSSVRAQSFLYSFSSEQQLRHQVRSGFLIRFNKISTYPFWIRDQIEPVCVYFIVISTGTTAADASSPKVRGSYSQRFIRSEAQESLEDFHGTWTARCRLSGETLHWDRDGQQHSSKLRYTHKIKGTTNKKFKKHMVDGYMWNIVGSWEIQIPVITVHTWNICR